MNRKDFDKKYFTAKSQSAKNEACLEYIHSLEQRNTAIEQQNKALIDERANMQKTHRSTINSLEEQNQGLQSLLDLKQQEISVLESKVGELVIEKSKAYKQGADDVYLLLTTKQN